VIVRCRICQELILSPEVGDAAANGVAFYGLSMRCAAHAMECHTDRFHGVSHALATQLMASLSLELFESQSPDLAQSAAALRTGTINAIANVKYSELTGKLEVETAPESQITL